MQNRQLALIELTKIEKNYEPTFDDEFLIYRFRKNIEQEVEGSQENDEGEEELDIVTNIEYNNYSLQCNITLIPTNLSFYKWLLIQPINIFKNILVKEAIRVITDTYITFWNIIINEENFDIEDDFEKLNELGSKINTNMGHMNLNLTKMLKIKNNDRETLKLYALDLHIDT